MTSPAPLAPRRKAFAEALGHLLAEVVWGEVVGAPEHEIAPPALAEVEPTGREMNDDKCSTVPHP